MFTKLINPDLIPEECTSNCGDNNCCDCGGGDDGGCGCAYCWSCHACDVCLNED